MGPRNGEPLFVISVAARLVEMHPQTLRKYEREGLVAPSRTSGNLRLYSDRDIERLRQVKYLVETRGLNLAGVQLTLDLTTRLRELRTEIAKTLAQTEPGAERGQTADACSPTDQLLAVWQELEQILAMLGHVDEPKRDASRSSPANQRG
jgi:MerR family transcriptional regulator/heat shock protein HspR